MTTNTSLAYSGLQAHQREVFNVTWQQKLTQSSGDTVNVLPLPNGIQILDVRVDFQGTASSTLSLGDSTSATRYFNAVSTASNGSTSLTVAGTQGVIGLIYSSDDTLVLTIGGAPVNGKVYTVSVDYSLNFDGSL